MNRLQEYLSTHLVPVDFILEYQEKRLPLALLFYKVCASFPKERLGSNKSAAKHLDSQKIGFLKDFINEAAFKEIIKSRNNFRPKNGQYIEFLATSLILTAADKTQLSFPSVEEDISEGWDFKFKDQKFDITTNLIKQPKKNINLVKLDLSKILDQKNLMLPNSLQYIASVLTSYQIPTDQSRVQYANLLVNKVREKYVELSHHEMVLRESTAPALVTTPSEGQWKIPNLNQQPILETTQVISTIQEFSADDLTLLNMFKQLSPETKSLLLKTIKSL